MGTVPVKATREMSQLSYDRQDRAPPPPPSSPSQAPTLAAVKTPNLCLISLSLVKAPSLLVFLVFVPSCVTPGAYCVCCLATTALRQPRPWSNWLVAGWLRGERCRASAAHGWYRNSLTGAHTLRPPPPPPVHHHHHHLLDHHHHRHRHRRRRC
ncbi:hypothetical protein E2C01_079917 [Portunus trituberculatus]|uniref:Uncharacterized protein n=1 Tax=Portunus trituberculatus TaxID=210409 RepID=A0A5B7IRT4_PORTR|nr:hypothetical protein [Portunus trituberculatus]